MDGWIFRKTFFYNNTGLFFTFFRLLVASRVKESGVEGVRFLQQLTSIQPRHQTPEVWLAVSISCRAA